MHTSKKSCNFVAESPSPGGRGWEVSPLGKPNLVPNPPVVALKTYLKRRLLTLCSDVMKCRSFAVSSELSNDRCPTEYRLSFLCLFWYVFCVYMHAHTCTLMIMWHGSIFYIRRGLRVVGSKIQGNATAS